MREEVFLEGQGSIVLDGLARASVQAQESGDTATLRRIHIHL